ncbi:MAG: glycosyltransferase family 1 protein, partial [Chloroflexi bacterium]
MKILIVVQRYGEEVVGGAEGHARSAAVQLSLRHQVEVTTTT